jgi:CSLREA domain-containing protein
MRLGPAITTLAVVASVAAVLVGPAESAVYRVTIRTDPAPGACTPGHCSLREAILAANASLGVADRIELPSRRPYVLRRAGDSEDGALTGDLDLTNDGVTIVHPGPGRATVDADGLDRVFDVYGPSTLRKLVVTGGVADAPIADYGGGIRASAGLRLFSTHVLGNRTTNCGGGIHTQNSAPLRLRDSRVAGNRAQGDGGGISASCFGGSGPVTIQRSTIASNRADSDADNIGRGGGIYLQTTSGVQSSIVSSTFSGNRTGSEGGGIYTDLGRLRVAGSTISGNRADALGGGIEVDGTEPLVVVNSTISGNRTDTNGGGISLDSGIVNLNAATVVRNRGNADGQLSQAGAGLFANSGNTFTVANSLIALNTLTSLTPGEPPIPNDCEGSFDSQGHNLLSTRFLCTGFDASGDMARANPKIAVLRDNGGPTKTVALRAASPARNRAEPSTSPSRDQRGVRRRDPDIGAFELR